MDAARGHDNNFNLIRLFAALQVLVVHCLNHFEIQTPVSSVVKSAPGVPIFYFISGFLIYSSYERLRGQGIRPFFINRILRIYPALWACFAVSLIAVVSTGYFRGRAIDVGHFVLWVLAQNTFFQFYNPDFMRDFGVGVLNGALWTISVELQFYLLTPVLFALITRRPKILGLLFLLSLALNLYLRNCLNWQLLAMKLIYASFGPWLYMYVLGFAAAHFKERAAAAGRVSPLILVPAYVLSMLFVGRYTANASNAINPLSFGILALLVLKAATFRLPVAGSATKFFRTTDFSYGLYLYHLPAINLLLWFHRFPAEVNALLALLSSLAAAVLSWYVVEKRALRNRRQPGEPMGTPVPDQS